MAKAANERALILNALGGLRKDSLKAHRNRDSGLMIRIGMMEPEESEEGLESASEESSEMSEESEPSEDDLMMLLAEGDEEDEEEEDEGEY